MIIDEFEAEERPPQIEVPGLKEEVKEQP